jgi:hypothetical protein
MQSNVTLKLDDALLKEVRKVAVDESMSLSGWVAGLIQDNLRKRGRRRLARRRALVALEAGFDLQPGRFSRDELHER